MDRNEEGGVRRVHLLEEFGASFWCRLFSGAGILIGAVCARSAARTSGEQLGMQAPSRLVGCRVSVRQLLGRRRPARSMRNRRLLERRQKLRRPATIIAVAAAVGGGGGWWWRSCCWVPVAHWIWCERARCGRVIAIGRTRRAAVDRLTAELVADLWTGFVADSETAARSNDAAHAHSARAPFDEHLPTQVNAPMAHTYSKRGASTSAVCGKTNGGEAATSKEEDYSPNHVVYKKVVVATVVLRCCLARRDSQYQK